MSLLVMWQIGTSVLKEPAASIFRVEVPKLLANHTRSHPRIPEIKEHFHIM
jgi:hypothetical protein